jgi:hypothetical protein
MEKIIRAARAAAKVFSDPNKVTGRCLLLAMKCDGQIFVLETKDQSIFSLQRRERATTKAQGILSGGGRGPWPLFCNQFNVIPARDKFRSGSFVKDHVMYEVLLIADCGVLGQKKGETAVEALDAHGFLLVPIKTHPFGAYVKRVLQFG